MGKKNGLDTCVRRLCQPSNGWAQKLRILKGARTDLKNSCDVASGRASALDRKCEHALPFIVRLMSSDCAPPPPPLCGEQLDLQPCRISSNPSNPFQFVDGSHEKRIRNFSITGWSRARPGDTRSADAAPSRPTLPPVAGAWNRHPRADGNVPRNCCGAPMPVGGMQRAPVYTNSHGRVECRFCCHFQDPRMQRPVRHMHVLAHDPRHPLLVPGARVAGQRAAALGSVCVCEPCMKSFKRGAGASCVPRPPRGLYMGLSSRISSDKDKQPVRDLGEVISPVDLLSRSDEDPTKYIRIRLFTPPRASTDEVRPPLDRGGDTVEAWAAAVLLSRNCALEYLRMLGIPTDSSEAKHRDRGVHRLMHRLDYGEVVSLVGQTLGGEHRERKLGACAPCCASIRVHIHIHQLILGLCGVV